MKHNAPQKFTRSLLDERRRTGTISLRAFYIRRAFRILPPALVFLSTIALLSSLKLIFSTPMGLLSSALCFRNYYISDPRDWFTGHFWSLSVEEHFYLIWPFLLILLLAARVRMLVPVLAIAAALWRTLDMHYQLIPAMHLNLFFRTDYRLDCLLWGCAAAILLDNESTRDHLRRLPALWALMGILCVILLNVFRPPQCMT